MMTHRKASGEVELPGGPVIWRCEPVSGIVPHRAVQLAGAIPASRDWSRCGGGQADEGTVACRQIVGSVSYCPLLAAEWNAYAKGR